MSDTKSREIGIDQERLDLAGSVGFVLMHLTPLLIIWAGVSWTAVVACLALYVIRMFGITAGYHRYFSHASYKTSRAFQFVLAWLGATAAQKGPLWWAANHRHHHKYSDMVEDVHSPVQRGFWWSHVGWILCAKYNETNYSLVKKLAEYPELRFLNKHYLVPPTVLAVMMFGLGKVLELYVPSLGTNGFQMLVWGFFVSTVVLYHGTFLVNSLAHKFGRRRFNTTDDSRNSFLIAIVTLGEGWHNNHHHAPASERQGFYWWEIDLAHYGLVMLSWLGLVWDLKTPPVRVYEEALIRDEALSTSS